MATASTTGISTRVRQLVAIGLLLIGGAAAAAALITVPDTLSCTAGTPNNLDIRSLITDYKKQNTAQLGLFYKKKKENNKTTLARLQSRKSMLLAAAARGSSNRAWLMPEPVRAPLADTFHNCVETPVTLTGTVEMVQKDMLDRSEQPAEAFLLSGNKKIRLVDLTNGKKNLPTNRTISLNGLLLDQTLFVTPDTHVAKISTVASSLAFRIPEDGGGGGNSPTVEKTVVLLFYFNDRPKPAYGISNVQATMASVQKFYLENSNNRLLLQGYLNPAQPADVVDWIKLPDNFSCTEVSSSWLNLAPASIDYKNYSRVIIVNTWDGCPWGGIASLGKQTLSTRNGDVTVGRASVTANGSDMYTYAHELGHTFGLEHANFLNCRTQPSSGSCITQAYDDRFDVMGWSNGHFNARHKAQLGWLTPSTIQLSGRYSIHPIESSYGNRALLIPNADPKGDLYIEYRQPVGYDQSLTPLRTPPYTSSDVFQGALLHFGSSQSSLTQDFDANASPDSPASVSDVVLRVGETWKNDETGIKVTIVAATAYVLTVDVQTPNLPASPTVAVTLDGVPTDTVTAPFTSSVTTSSPVSRVDWYYQGYYEPYVIVSDADAPYSATINPNMLGNDYGYIFARAVTASGVTFDSDWMLVNAQNPDHINPTVSITSPSGSTIELPLTITSTSADNVGIMHSGVDVWQSGSKLFSSEYAGPPNNVTLKNVYPNYPVEVDVYAYDYAGNQAFQSKTFNVTDSQAPSINFISPSNGGILQQYTGVIASVTDNGMLVSVAGGFDGAMNNLLVTDDRVIIPFDPWTTLTQGAHTFTIRAIDQQYHTVTKSLSVIIDRDAPTVVFSNPPTTLSGLVTIRGVATENYGLNYVYLYRDDGQLLALINQSSCTKVNLQYTCNLTFDASPLTTGAHTLYLWAADVAGNLGVSSKITVTR